MVAAKFRKEHKNVDVTLLEPGDTHYYQPALDPGGAGTFRLQEDRTPMSSVMPKGVNWVKDKATGFDPRTIWCTPKRTVIYLYDYLVVATGLVMEPTMIEGLAEALDKGTVVSNYTNPEYTWEVIRNFKAAMRSLRSPPHLSSAAVHRRRSPIWQQIISVRKELQISPMSLCHLNGRLFGEAYCRHTLMEVINRYDIHFKPFLCTSSH